MGQPLYFKKNTKGLPIVGSNLKANAKPSSAHTQIVNVINAPLPDSVRPRFYGTTNRYFVQFNSSTGALISGSLIESTNVPEGSYLEVFSNNTVALPLGSETNSGVVNMIATELNSIPFMMSEDFRVNGYRKNTIAV